MPASAEPQARLVRHISRQAMARDLARRVAASLASAIKARGKGSLAVSGGSTPKLLYEALSRATLDWSKITVILVDERWVGSSEEGSNEAMVWQSLLQNAAKAAEFVGLKAPGETPFDGLTEARRRLDVVDFPIDVTILGIGPDGHTASWFPRAAGLSEALANAGEKVSVLKAQRTAVTGPWCQRISLTRAALASSRQLLLLLTGEAKRQSWDLACGPGPVENMPVRALLRDPAVALAAHWAP